ncbi:MAG: TetR/AcrR family transcriptional regulator [Polyangiaceae bacterium]
MGSKRLSFVNQKTSAATNMFALDVVVPEKKKHRRNAEETKKRILTAAETEFATKGFDGTRLATIANAAEVQQALIHHYFSDKAGLYREVIAQNLGAMSEQGWTILDRLAVRAGRPKIREIADAFVGMIIEFYASHGAILSILRHESSSVDDLALKVISEKVKPVFDAVVAYIEDMKRRKEIRADVDPHHLCVSALALATVSTQDERLLRGMWHVDVQSPEFLLKRKSEIVEMIVSRVEISATSAVKTKSPSSLQGSGGTLERRSASKRSRRRRG